jgi:hypothetical protein
VRADESRLTTAVPKPAAAQAWHAPGPISARTYTAHACNQAHVTRS